VIVKGQKINDRYQIIKTIGEGGMANVYLAYDTILDRNVAVKILRGDLANDEKFVRRFQREALAASSLSHPNIVEVYDVGEDSGQYYIVMEYIEGKHLKQLIKKRGNLTIREVVDIMLQITDGIALAHDSYIIHRDIKPQNIMILENGMVKITDFGIAQAINSTQLTQTNSVMGSVHYLPPEQANGKGSTLKSDIYSMGILMYELLTGKLPYKGDNAVEIALKHLKEPIPSIKEELPDLSQPIENVILKSTAKNPKNRYNDAREMFEDLKTVLDETRAEEKKFEYDYQDAELDETRMLKISKQMQEDIKVDDKVLSKQINETDVKKENKLLIILASIFTGLIVIITSIVFLLPIITGQKEKQIPDVSNMSVSDAINKLQDAGFKVSDTQKDIASENIEAGKVVKTNPEIGIRKVVGTEIILYISIGDATIDIEDYTSKNYLSVKGALEARGLHVLIDKKDVEDSNKKYEDSQIIEQSIEAGTKLAKGDTITLYIPNVITKYPDFTDGTYSVNDVETFASEHGIKLTIKYVATSEYAPGTIIGQSRNEGYTVASNTTFEIRVAEKEESEGVDCLEGMLC